VEILIIGSPRKKNYEGVFSDLLKRHNRGNITVKNFVPFDEFSNSYADYDICFDLREKNFESAHCLPIKIFYYTGSGKPVIYSDLKAIKNHIDVSKFGYLANPKDSETIAKLIENYVENPELYDSHAENARKMFEEKYNWEKIKNLFLEFIKNSIKH
jgi:glycosyltransferase involved in cell wall biosynthesis